MAATGTPCDTPAPRPGAWRVRQSLWRWQLGMWAFRVSNAPCRRAGWGRPRRQTASRRRPCRRRCSSCQCTPAVAAHKWVLKREFPFVACGLFFVEEQRLTRSTRHCNLPASVHKHTTNSCNLMAAATHSLLHRVPASDSSDWRLAQTCMQLKTSVHVSVNCGAPSPPGCCGRGC